MNDGENQMPAYARNDVFQKLLALARQAGITIEFIPGDSLEDGLAESEPDARVILMTDHGTLPVDVSPVAVLAEEMAYILTETAPLKYKEVYAQFEQESMAQIEPDIFIHSGFENSADLISVALVQLAEMMVGTEVERQFKIIREIRHPD